MLSQEIHTNPLSAVQLSFLTTTVFGTGNAPTVTVTPLPVTITQMQTVTVTAGGVAAANPAHHNQQQVL
jgi:hypothetical protein